MPSAYNRTQGSNHRSHHMGIEDSDSVQDVIPVQDVVSVDAESDCNDVQAQDRNHENNLVIGVGDSDVI
eukprot:CAMPEP_0204614752 /NCGR_PEP_ID=MMETSP0717-20131115/2406_1 /ASSEMBLY_ACC=CAM_ASM_000666 /TAXON_ID=230516 /ORGANISM="Chaetoceros curvisetus" /LENGTH=68 /DNA_ID=CAMNT_0051627503 /DNA_START=561 /DNA_END=763 /DNA_ORIENTATION=-